MSDILKAEGDAPTTGHVWDDDLADFTNPPPKWWMLGLLASALWVVAYWVIYPSVPIALAGMHWTGVGVAGMDGKWTAIKELAVDQATLDKVRGPYEEKNQKHDSDCDSGRQGIVRVRDPLRQGSVC